MGTFGETGTGDGNNAEDPNCKDASKFTCNGNGTIIKLTVRVWVISGTTHVRGVIYSDNAGEPNAKLAEGTEVAVTNTSAAWIDLPISLVCTNGTVYHLGYIVEETLQFRIQSSTNVIHWNGDFYAGGAADPFGANYDSTNHHVCIYATYTEAGGATIQKGSSLANTMLTMLNSKMLFNACKRFPKAKGQPRRFPSFNPRIVT